jgi:phosphoribosylaminoimidazole (AIR) synthetase
MVVVIAAEDAEAAVRILSAAGEMVFRIGHIEARSSRDPQLVFS